MTTEQFTKYTTQNGQQNISDVIEKALCIPNTEDSLIKINISIIDQFFIINKQELDTEKTFANSARYESVLNKLWGLKMLLFKNQSELSLIDSQGISKNILSITAEYKMKNNIKVTLGDHLFLLVKFNLIMFVREKMRYSGVDTNLSIWYACIENTLMQVAISEEFDSLIKKFDDDVRTGTSFMKEFIVEAIAILSRFDLLSASQLEKSRAILHKIDHQATNDIVQQKMLKTIF